MDEFLHRSPEMIGSVEHYHKYNKTLPFLFKILSVAQPLSLQAHPDKKLAQALHKKDPKNYPDSNHKPELAIALTDFEVLCDFRPHHEIVHFLKVIAPLRRIAGDENCEKYCTSVQQNESPELQRCTLAGCFKTLMTSSKESVAKETKTLLSDFDGCQSSSPIDANLKKLISQIEKLYPGDPGVFAPFFLNYLKLIPGQAIYLKANKLHAYLKGECIECMACSDNVVRAGLTTKYRDVETLISMLDYEPVKNSNDILLAGALHPKQSAVISFAPAEEFKVDKISITQKTAPDGEYTLSPLLSGSFIIVLAGKASANDFLDMKVVHKLALGSAGFVPPKIALKLYNIHSPLTIYRSYC